MLSKFSLNMGEIIITSKGSQNQASKSSFVTKFIYNNLRKIKQF